MGLRLGRRGFATPAPFSPVRGGDKKMTKNEIYAAPVRDGAMLDAPVYETHKRGKNWMATIGPDPAAPGGVARTFVPRGRGEYYYIVSPDLVGQPVEFGGDYYSGAGNRSAKRWYGVVRALTGEEIRIERYETATLAIAAAQAGPDLQALEEERARLLARVAEIDALMEGGPRV